MSCEPGDQKEADRLSVDIVSWPSAQIGILGGLEAEKLGRRLIDIGVWLAEK